MNRLPLAAVLLMMATFASATRSVDAQAALNDLTKTGTGKNVPWSLRLDFDQSVTVRSFNKRSQLSYDPHYIWWLTYAPRWKFNDRWSIGGLGSLSYELTQSPESEFNRPGFYGRQTQWDDLRLDATYRLPETKRKWNISARFDVRLPFSKFSRSRSRVLGPGARIAASRTFDVAKGLTLSPTFGVSGWFARSNVAEFEDYPCRLAPSSANGSGVTDACFGGTSAGIFNVVPSMTVSIAATDKLSFYTTGLLFMLRGAKLKTGCIETLTGTNCLGDESGRDHWRMFSDFTIGVTYRITSYLTGSLSYDTWSQHPDSGGNVENPFYNENTRLILGLSLRTHALYTHIKGKRNTRESPTPVADR